MPTGPDDSEPLYHLALLDEWKRAAKSGTAYRRSTLGTSLDDVGFIHCSFSDQVQRIADLFYRGRSDVVLLVIDRSRIEAEVRVENLEGGEDLFPHIYGPLPVAAVARAEAVPIGTDGGLSVRSLLDPP